MSEKANYFKIGLFVLCALAIVVAGVTILGAGALFRASVEVETYVKESVQGLEIGSPVRYRGVKIGNVSDIAFVSNYYGRDADLTIGKEDARRYVLIRFDVYLKPLGAEPYADLRPFFHSEVRNGLRATLGNLGVTGALYIEVDYYDPEEYPPAPISWHPQAYYIPSIPSTITRWSDSLENIFTSLEETRINEVVDTLDSLFKNMNEKLAGADVAGLQREAQALVSELRETNRRANALLTTRTLATFLDDAAQAAAEAREAASGFRRLAGDLNTLVDDNDETLAETLEDLSRVAQNLRQTSERIDRLLADETIDATLQDITAMSADVSEMAHQAREDLRQAGQQVSMILRRLDRLVSSEQDQFSSIVRNIRQISEDIRELVGETKRYPSSALFGSPPPPPPIQEGDAQ